MAPAPLSVVRLILTGIAIGAAILLFARAVAGPFSLVHNPIGLECAAAVSLLLLLLIANPQEEQARAGPSPRWHGWLVLAAVAIAFAPILSIPLVTDDYIHIHLMATSRVPMPLGCVTDVSPGSQYFRPLGCFSLWMDWRIWGMNPVPRHVADLVLHAASSLLFFFLLRRLKVAAPFDTLGALVFACLGLRPEVAAWPAARFDALALLFSLIAALAALRRSHAGLAIACIATGAACLAKESAFVLPILLVPLFLREPEDRLRKPIVPIAAVFACAIAVLMVRLWLMRGIGGYVDSTGAPKFLDVNLLTLAKTFLARIWGILWFPLNWSTPFEWWMLAGLAGGIAAFALLIRARPKRKPFAIAVACIAVACVPAHHLLLIDQSLERSRYLTLATIPFVFMLVLAWTGLPRRLGVVAAALILCFELAALEHNLNTWARVAFARKDACRQVANLARKWNDAPIAITGMPLIVDGVYWSNGFEHCLQYEFGIPMGRVRVNGASPAAGERELQWEGIQPVRLGR